MKNFCLVWGSLLESSLWIDAEKETRLVWITMLAMKDVRGQVHSTVKGISYRARVSVEEAAAAIEFLLKPDPYSQNKDHEGRRIIPLETGDGWFVVSHDKYRFGTEAARAYWRTAKAEQRKRQEEKEAMKIKRSRPSPGETAAMQLYAAGDDEAAERLAEPAAVEAGQDQGQVVPAAGPAVPNAQAEALPPAPVPTAQIEAGAPDRPKPPSQPEIQKQDTPESFIGDFPDSPKVRTADVLSPSTPDPRPALNGHAPAKKAGRPSIFQHGK